jgi:hypothetical protein
MVRSLRLVVLLFVGALLGSCTTADPVQRLAPFRFDDKPPLRLLVANLEVQSRYTPPLRAPNVDHQFPITPENAMRQWAKDRLVPSGGSQAVARFIVLDASVVEEALPRTSGVRGALTTDQAERYSAKAEAVLEIADPSGRVIGTTEARVSLSRTVPEGVTLNEREKFWYTLTGDLIAQFDREMEATVRRYLVNWLQ